MTKLVKSKINTTALEKVLLPPVIVMPGFLGIIEAYVLSSRISWNCLNANWLERTVIGRY